MDAAPMMGTAREAADEEGREALVDDDDDGRGRRARRVRRDGRY